MKKALFILAIILLVIFFSSCGNSPNNKGKSSNKKQELTHLLNSTVNRDQMDFFTFQQIRLGDGVPLGVKLAIRWKITDSVLLLDQFESIDDFRSYILKTRCLELMNEAFNEFISVDSVFSSQRLVFINRLKEIITNRLGEDGMEIKEVICEQLNFPETYTDAMEKAGLQRQEMERINQETILAVARAEADKKKAEASAKVEIARANAADRVEKIKAKTEKSRRASQLAAAETQKQIAYKKAQTESDRLKLLAQTDLEKQRNLKKMDIEHEEDQIAVEVDRKKKMDMADFEIQMELAKVFQDNPIYATYLVNKEMASKVKIAVLPPGSDASVFGSLLNQTIPVSKKDD